MKNKTRQLFCSALFLIVTLALSLSTPEMAVAQSSETKSIDVSGEVFDSQGTALAGVSVLVEQLKSGVITDGEGKFFLENIPENATLRFSFIGMKTQEVQVDSRTQLSITMGASEYIDLNEVVVTAFATQKKVNVTGAISTVSGRDLKAAPVSNITNALIGNAPGVSGLQSSGEPGRNSSSIRIRGISTYGDSAPLVVIDGVEQPSENPFIQLDAMDPNEILGISVLKDASSTAVYGIRGANGVIIVTTKRGVEGSMSVNFSANYGVTKASNLQRNLSSHDWAYMRNEAIRHEMDSYAGAAGLSPYIYSEMDLWKFRNNRDFAPSEIKGMDLTDAQKMSLMNSPALYYGSADIYGDQFGEYGPQAQVNVSVSGGTPKLKYHASLGYFSQEGITRNDRYHGARTGSNFDRYNFRTNLDIDIYRNLRLSVNIAGQFGKANGPGYTEDPFNLEQRYIQTMQFVYETNPIMNQGIVDGRLIQRLSGEPGSIQNPLAVKTNSKVGNQNAVYNLFTSGYSEIFNSMLDNTIRLEHEMDYLTKGLKIHGSVNFKDNYNRLVVRQPSLPAYSVQRNIEDPNIIEFFDGEKWGDSFDTRGTRNWNEYYLEAGLSWNGTFDKHNLSALFIGKASQYLLPWDVNNTNTPSGVVGLVGRVTYDYDSRYLLELNAGYNGTEQFRKGKRFGFFPAVSAGWVLTNEKFFPDNEWLTFFKIRGSYGEVGNDRHGDNRRYLYLLNTWNTDQSPYWWGSTGNNPSDAYPGISEGELGYHNITWERSKQLDIGFESRFFSDRLTLNFDYFEEDRSNILTTLQTIPGIFGVPLSKVPPANVGKTTNKGYEVVLSWADNVGDFNYYIEGHLSYARNKIDYKAEPENPYYWMNETGFSIGQRFGYKSDGLYNTIEDLANRPYMNQTSNKATLGDVRYMDLNGDGVINDRDIAPIGYPNFPEYHYGIKVGFSFKGFDVAALFNGTANGSFYVTSKMANPYYKSAGNAWDWQYNGRWTAEKAAAGVKASFPRATYDATHNDNNYLVSDYWMYSNNFFKLKNIEIGYTFSSSSRFLRAARISSLRVYLSGNNLVTFKNDMKDMGIDPETADGASYIYPLTRVFNAGISIQF